MANVFRLLLFPFAFLYGTIVWLRNLFFDLGWLPSKSFPIPVVCVGNLEMGGSGKTPMIDSLIAYFHKKYKIACLSRGYGRKTKGFLLAGPDSSPEELGDEPFQIYQKWSSQIVLAVDEDRVNGVEKLLKNYPDLDLILLDDGMQHRWIKPKITIQLSPFQKPFFKNRILPMGSLREFVSGSQRAQFHIFTKTENLDEIKRKGIKTQLNALNLPNENVFLSEIVFGKAQNLNGKMLEAEQKVTVVSGLASNKGFFEKAKSTFLTERCISKPDHYRYLPDFFEKEGLSGKVILCTEKDFHKILRIAPQPELVYFLPIHNRIFPEKEFWLALEKCIEA
jgi:tetraacyldisaccharide 4'-kinase